MGIGIENLSPWAQKQAMQKLAEQQRKKQKQAAGREAKYKNVKDQRTGEDGGTIRFDSKKEARRFDELSAMLRAGAIRDLKLQPQFTIQEAYTTPEGKRVRAIRYQADFSYLADVTTTKDDGEKWVLVVEDVKSRATMTRVYEIKKKLIREKFGIDIREV